MTVPQTSLDQLAVNTIRTLSIDAVQAANSGHPGAPMGAAPMAYVLWDRFLHHAPTAPDWADRDRFVLSAGHAATLLYSLLHLTGYDISLDDLRSFRQFGSRTPGHPEYGAAPGIEATTGPLGQGFTNGVGMALAERLLAARYNRPGHEIVDHWTYVVASDGDIQEGIVAEAASLAGHLRLGKLVVLYDDNHIQLDGPTAMAFSEDVLRRFDAYGWHTARVAEGNDLAAVEAAITAARADDRPSLIAVRTHIGFGSPNRQDSPKAHGAPLGADEVRLTKQVYGWDPDLSFHVPDEVASHCRRAVARGEESVAEWRRRFDAYRAAYPAEAAELERRLSGDLPAGWTAAVPWYDTGSGMATRQASQAAIQAIAGVLPELTGGAADLSESNLTDIKGEPFFTVDAPARNIRYGVREHAMGGIANGLAYHGGILPFVGTFMVFSDYMRGSVRLAALSRLRVVYVWTHDSIGVGEDGPTHEPVEHVAALRAIPNLDVMRPGDPNEASAAWQLAVERRDGPTALALSRQKLPVLDGTKDHALEGTRQGGYVLADAIGPDGKPVTPDLILLATGSELQLAIEAREKLAGEGIRARVVSLPCWERFAAQPAGVRDAVLPPGVTKRVSIEAGVSLGWHRWVGPEGAIIAIDRFGLSAPGPAVMETFGFSAGHVVDVAKGVLAGTTRGIVAIDPGEVH